MVGGGGGGGWVGGVVVGGGAGALVVGVTAGAGVLDDPETCVVGVVGVVGGAGIVLCVVDVPCPAVVDVVVAVGDVVGDVVGAVGATFEAGIPLFNAANQTLPTFCPVACPFVLSPSKRYSGIRWNATCQWSLPTFITARPFTPFGPDTRAPFGARRGGQILAQAPVHDDVPGLSSVKRYSVRPEAVVGAVPTPLHFGGRHLDRLGL